MRQLANKIIKNSLWLSILLHLLLFSGYSLVWIYQSPEEKSPELDIPSYVYQQPPTVSRQMAAAKNVPEAKTAIKKSAPENVQRQENVHPTPTQPSAMSKVASDKQSEAIHLIGEKNVDQPLKKILGRAIAAHLIYPRVAADFEIRGECYIGFTLHPNGVITNVQLVKSSRVGVLDEAALSAIETMGPVRHVAPYIKEPRFLVISIIFG